MTQLQRDFWLQFVASLFRKLLFTLGTFLVTHGFISDNQAEGLTTGFIVETLAGGALLVVPILWQYAKLVYNEKIQKALLKADTGTPASVVKTDVLAESKFISSV